jgi:signal transduction histidine kinase/ligand-binding sensor domain-containing protein
MGALIIAALALGNARAAEADTGTGTGTYWRSGLLQTGWSKKDGAPASVYSMTQDSAGMIWFAASDGLYHFDGARFERVDGINGHKLLSPVTMCVDAFGDQLWVGYQYGGVSVFEHGAVRHYGEAQGAPAGTIYHFGRMPGGTMWFSSGTGMHWLDGDRWRHAGVADGLPDGPTVAFNILHDGSLLVYFPDGVYRSTPNGRRFRRVLQQPGVEGGELRADGTVLINSQQRGMQLFDPAAGTVTPFALHNGGLPMMGFASDRRGALWVSVGSGIQLLDRTQRPQKTFTPAQGLVGKTFGSMLDDREGNMWLATEGGINRVRETRLTTIELPVGMDVPSVAAGEGGAVWINNLFTQGNFKHPTIGIGADGARTTTPMVRVSASVRAADGATWFAADRAVWRRQGEKAQSWNKPAALLDQDVQAMAMDTQGTLWLSVIGHGVYGLRDGVWLPNNGRDDLEKLTAVSLLTDAGGSVWFGYTQNHLARLEHGRMRRFDAADGLAVGNVLAMSRRGPRLWLGGDQGVAYFDGGRFVALKNADGQDFRGVSGIVETVAGELWLHDADGLVRIAPRDLAGAAVAEDGARVASERFDYLDGHEGAPSQIRPIPTLVEAGDGRLWYATTGSVGWIDPAHISRNRLAPIPAVTALRTAVRTFPAPPAGLVLPPHTDNLELTFTAAALSIPERVRFRYRLVGLDAGWRDAGTARQASYTNLGPGDYRFEVMAANEDGVWSRAPSGAAFRITPSPTQTVWFKLACALAALAALWMLHRWRVAAATARIGERLHERATERERIARTLHDTFLQSVQALIWRFDLIKNRLPPADPVQEQIELALQAADDVISEGREQVMDLRVGSTRVGDLATALADAGAALSAQYGAVFRIDTAGTPRRLAAEVEDEAFAIGREALFNAFRHGGGFPVRIALDYAASAFTLCVNDAGPGIGADILAARQRPGHWGLVGMRERAERVGGALDIASAPGAGTRVSFTVRTGMPARFFAGWPWRRKPAN